MNAENGGQKLVFSGRGLKSTFLKEDIFTFLRLLCLKMAEIIILLSHSDSLKSSNIAKHWEKKRKK